MTTSLLHFRWLAGFLAAQCLTVAAALPVPPPVTPTPDPSMVALGGAPASSLTLDTKPSDSRIRSAIPSRSGLVSSSVHRANVDEDAVQISASIEGPGVTQSEHWSETTFLGREGRGPLRFVVRRSGALLNPTPFRVHYRMDTTYPAFTGPSGETVEMARLGRDFQVESLEGDLEFGPGVTERSVEVSLPNDAEFDGPRYLEFRWSGIDGSTQFGTGAAGLVLMDDELQTLKQQVVLEPYYDQSWNPQITITGSDRPGFHVTGDSTILRLGPEGLPDPTYGLGTGRAILPRAADGTKVIYYPYMGPLELRPDGGLQFIGGFPDTEGYAVVRLTAAGLPDTQFGSGTGLIHLTRQLHRTAHGDFLVQRSTEGWKLNRLRSDFSEDPGFVTWNSPREIQEIQVSPQGSVWVQVFSPEQRSVLLRLESSGVPDPNFRERRGLAFGRGVDAMGRAYFQLQDPAAFGDSVQGSLVRFHPDGFYDEAYRPLVNRVITFLELSSSGTALAILESKQAVEIGADGSVRLLHESPHLSSARRQADGAVHLGFHQCSGPGFPPSCGSWDKLLLPSGVLTDFRLPDASLPQDPQSIWNWSGVSSNQGGGSSYRNARLWRTTPPTGPNQVGMASTGVYAWESAIEVTLQRSGSNTAPARVSGKVLPGAGHPRDDQAAIPFDLEFRAGEGEVTLMLPQLARPGRQPLREYVVRVERATGVELSPFTGCRIWVLDDESQPTEQALRLEAYPGRDEPDVVLLLGRWNVHRSNGYNLFGNLNQPPYQTPPEWPVELGPIWLKTIRTDRESQLFFQPSTLW